jgi:transcriptional regulator with XRE-family HTH domain
MWENGRIVPDDENLEKLAEVYKVNPKWLSCENPLRLTLEQGIQKAGRDVAGMPELDRDEYLMILAALPE